VTDADLSPVKRALLEQRRLKARVQELERALEVPRTEPVAVIGIGCRFPGANGVDAFWQMLAAGVDAIGEMPADRWNVATQYDADPEAPGKIATRFGGYLTGIDLFDAQRLGISPREAATMDPQQRILLEVAWDALEHAGLAPDTLTGSPTGVFVGIGPTDYLQRFVQRGLRADIDAYLATGNAHSVASGRMSYLLGLHGPAISVDTACSSSLVAIQLACESIRGGACDVALAGGVGVLLGDHNYISLSKARMMAPDGRCKAFDSRADGFVRSEGCGIVVLKRLSAAQRDGDRVLAVIRGGAINQDGRSNGLTAPNGPAQQAVIRAAHANAGTTPSSVSYVEAHGTGTALGDPIEVESLAAVLGEGRDPDQPIHLGSVKTNIGHTEAAAGVAGLIKTVLALHHGQIPPSLHFQKPNPLIAWDEYPYVRVAARATAWPSVGAPRTAGVSAFGFSGTNVHLVVEEAPAESGAAASLERPLHVLALSAKTEAAFRVAAGELADYVAATRASVADVCYSINTSRATFERRTALVATSLDDLRAQLAQIAAHGAAAPASDATPRVLFACGEIDDAAVGVARTLFATQPAFRAAIEQCIAACVPDDADAVRRVFAIDAPAAPNGVPAALRAIVRLAVLFAAAAMWKQWGVQPDALLDDGAGDVTALLLAGSLSLEQAIAATRGDRAGDDRPAVPLVPIFSGMRGRRMTGNEAALAASGAPASDVRGAEPSARAREAAARDGYTTIIGLNTLAWPALAERLAGAFAAGASIDWRGVDRGYHRRRVDVPTSPWIRERYWFEEAPRVYEPRHDAWSMVTRVAGRQAARVPADVELSVYHEMWAELDAFTTGAVAKTLRQVGLFSAKGERQTVESATSTGGILPVYHHLVSLWLQRLVRAGLLARDGDAFVAATDGGLATPSLDDIGPRTAEFPILRDYLRRCERAMAAIVTGRESPLDTLFADGSLETGDFLYRRWGLARYSNGIVESVADALAGAANGRRLKVLEIGAGTGGTSSQVIPLLATAACEYWFTDISEYFFSRAEEEFAAMGDVRFRRFDLDEAPGAQQIPVGQFDLVIASNAVHATKNLGQAIEHARSLLAPGGLLMLYEATTHFDWFEMSVALIEGWQHHVDALRGETPLLSPEQWQRALRERGFDRVATFPAADSPAAVFGHHVILAAVPADAIPAQMVTVEAPGVSATVTPAPAPSLVAPTSAPGASGAGTVRDRLAALTVGERVELLRDIVQRQVIRVMRLRATAPAPSMTDRLMSIGMDSLMAVELRKMLGKELDGAVAIPSTLIFDYPTIGAIVDLILTSLGLAEVPVAAPAAPAAAANAAAAIADLSDAEVEAMLLEQLKGL
jgi:3-oxoacyl-(acyl-carrier-protein) synthase/SAM-dependent methyltransferase/acyl carrier protein